MIAPFVSLPLFGLQFIFPNIFLYFLYKNISGTPCEPGNVIHKNQLKFRIPTF